MPGFTKRWAPDSPLKTQDRFPGVASPLVGDGRSEFTAAHEGRRYGLQPASSPHGRREIRKTITLRMKETAMNGRNGIRLMLNRETLRNLQDSDLAAVAGGRVHRQRSRERVERTEIHAASGGCVTHQPDTIGAAMNARMGEEMHWDGP